MKTHAQIIEHSGKDAALAEKLNVKPYQVRDWRLRGRIPPEHWKAFAGHGYATLEELAEAAAERADANPGSSGQAAA